MDFKLTSAQDFHGAKCSSPIKGIKISGGKKWFCLGLPKNKKFNSLKINR